jgi:hypothetical protein
VLPEPSAIASSQAKLLPAGGPRVGEVQLAAGARDALSPKILPLVSALVIGRDLRVSPSSSECRLAKMY